MQLLQDSLIVETRGRGTYDITGPIERFIAGAGVETGLCHVFIHHTSASLMLCENADPDVRRDLETFMARLVPDGDPDFVHRDEGPDDMPAHVRTVLTQTGLSIPVVRGRSGLGTWQGVYVWEHRTASHRRHITLTLQGR
ncbi:MAG TPA: YjbQ family protein [Thioalkalivibrio sp.]|nr:YjbQ family protein [Thioalkalivibrio sp.]